MRIISLSIVFTLVVVTLVVTVNGFSVVASDAPSAATPVSERVVTISIERFRYEPQQIEVQVGTRVRWINRDGAAHTVTVDGLFDSGRMSLSATYSRVFDRPGSYLYECIYHQNMTGRVVVVDPYASPVATPAS